MNLYTRMLERSLWNSDLSESDLLEILAIVSHSGDSPCCLTIKRIYFQDNQTFKIKYQDICPKDKGKWVQSKRSWGQEGLSTGRTGSCRLEQGGEKWLPSLSIYPSCTSAFSLCPCTSLLLFLQSPSPSLVLSCMPHPHSLPANAYPISHIHMLWGEQGLFWLSHLTSCQRP